MAQPPLPGYGAQAPSQTAPQATSQPQGPAGDKDASGPRPGDDKQPPEPTNEDAPALAAISQAIEQELLGTKDDEPVAAASTAALKPRPRAGTFQPLTSPLKLPDGTQKLPYFVPTNAKASPQAQLARKSGESSAPFGHSQASAPFQGQVLLQ